MVITGVAATTPERLRRPVYLGAYLPDEGQTELDLWPEEMRAAIKNDEAASRGCGSRPLQRSSGSPIAVWRTGSRRGRRHTRTTPHPLATYTQAALRSLLGSAGMPRAYITFTAGPTTPIFGPFAARARALGWDVREIAAGHDAMLTAPDEVAQALLQVAER